MKMIVYNEIFLPVAKYYAIRVLMVIVNQYNLELEHMDIKTSFYI